MDSELYNLAEAPGDCDTKVYHRLSPINMNDFHYHAHEYEGRLCDARLRNIQVGTGNETIYNKRLEQGHLR